MFSFNSDSEQPKREPRIPFLVYFKTILLTTIMLSAAFFISKASVSPQKLSVLKSKSPTISALAQIKSQLLALSPDDVKKLASKSAVQQSSQYVLGAMTRATDGAIDGIAETATDYVYEHTIEQVIKSLLDRLPARQQELIRARMCQTAPQIKK